VYECNKPIGENKHGSIIHCRMESGRPYSILVDGYVTSRLEFNFALRLMIATRGDDGLAISPFSVVDAELLRMLRKSLIDLGGTPPALPNDSQQCK
jgi:hypothetical protein